MQGRAQSHHLRQVRIKSSFVFSSSLESGGSWQVEFPSVLTCKISCVPMILGLWKFSTSNIEQLWHSFANAVVTHKHGLCQTVTSGVCVLVCVCVRMCAEGGRLSLLPLSFLLFLLTKAPIGRRECNSVDNRRHCYTLRGHAHRHYSPWGRRADFSQRAEVNKSCWLLWARKILPGVQGCLIHMVVHGLTSIRKIRDFVQTWGVCFMIS